MKFITGLWCLLFFTGTSSLLAEVNDVKEVKLPEYLRQALADNYETGRRVLKLGGVSQLNRFAIPDGHKKRVFFTLKELIRLTARHPQSQIVRTCTREVGPQLTDRDLNNCSRFLLEHRKSFALDEILANWRDIDEDASSEEQTFSKTSQIIKEFIEAKLGKYYIEYFVSETMKNRNVLTSVLFSADYKKAIVVSYDIGA